MGRSVAAQGLKKVCEDRESDRRAGRFALVSFRIHVVEVKFTALVTDYSVWTMMWLCGELMSSATEVCRGLQVELL